jgi:tRNA(His) 5'-end guanylyltransferase
MPALYFVLSVVLPIVLAIRLLLQLKSEQFNHNDALIPVPLGDRMKYYEKQSESLQTIPANLPFIVRLDGRAFSNFTLQFKKNLPYSVEFKRAMLGVATDLLHEFKASTVYTHSDEITLIFSEQDFTNNASPSHIFNGRCSKLLSLISSYASVSFDRHMSKECEQSNIQQYKHVPTFDARIIVFCEKNKYEIVNHMIWRSKGDCTRNFVSMYAEKYIGKKKIIGVPMIDRIIQLKKMGIDLAENGNIDFAMKHGTFIKSINGSNTYHVFKNLKFSLQMLNFLTSNVYNPELIDDIVYTESTKDQLFNFPCVILEQNNEDVNQNTNSTNLDATTE